MEELKRDLGYWLYLDIDNNDYLNKLYCKLVFQYTNSLLKQEYYLEDKKFAIYRDLQISYLNQMM